MLGGGGGGVGEGEMANKWPTPLAILILGLISGCGHYVKCRKIGFYSVAAQFKHKPAVVMVRAGHYGAKQVEFGPFSIPRAHSGASRADT